MVVNQPCPSQTQTAEQYGSCRCRGNPSHGRREKPLALVFQGPAPCALCTGECKSWRGGGNVWWSRTGFRVSRSEFKIRVKSELKTSSLQDFEKIKTNPCIVWHRIAVWLIAASLMIEKAQLDQWQQCYRARRSMNLPLCPWSSLKKPSLKYFFLLLKQVHVQCHF